ncbi:Putative esterase [Pustulibacterium marinum]|uniref:Putative esterase n=1 Tax=Pustulibacterium marinum TaxID=1224947 RepID=A0A1I7F3Q2_9FLAO|nr:prolyl oligopeptidase family serine peptidase [Pustulibacterium marinum]SFU30833.1 Putative esterase [Pustulibacterium marinum]
MNKLIFFLFLFAFGSLQAQDTFEPKQYISGKDTLKYQILYPENFSETQTYPVVLFLHGAGERGNDNKAQLTHGSSLFLSDSVRTKYPAIVIFPQCPKEDYWANVDVDRSSYPLKLDFKDGEEPTTALKLVTKLMEETIQQEYVQKDQVYIMGLSMGGMGTFEMIFRNPNMFAAAIPICGGAHPNTAKAYADHLPIWVFHGAKDDVVDPKYSLQMVSAILKDGGFPQYTLYEDANHNSWDATFHQPKLLSWLFSNKNTTNINTTK